MPSLVRNITFDCHDPERLARFWAEVIGRPVDSDDEGAWIEGGDDAGSELPSLLFLPVPESKTVKNRVHLDLQPSTSRDEEVERLTELGATVVDDRRKADGTGWVVMADPEGNEFCVERSRAEREAHSAQEAGPT